MRLLLDTHVWIWFVTGSGHLRKRVLRELNDLNNELWLSPISTWEAIALHHKRRVHLEGGPEEWLERATAGTREAALTHEIVLMASGLPLHKDPADRFLAATAMVLDLVLVTADVRLLGLGNLRTLANR